MAQEGKDRSHLVDIHLAPASPAGASGVPRGGMSPSGKADSGVVEDETAPLTCSSISRRRFSMSMAAPMASFAGGSPTTGKGAAPSRALLGLVVLKECTLALASLCSFLIC